MLQILKKTNIDFVGKRYYAFGFSAVLVMLGMAAIVAMFSDPPILPKVLFAILSIESLRIFETMYLSPRIVGSKIGLHPLLVIFSILVFFYFFGFLGLLIAVPTTALIITFIKEWEATRKGVPPGQYHATPAE